MKKPIYIILALIVVFSVVIVGVRLRQRAGEATIESTTAKEVNRQLEVLKKQQPKTFKGTRAKKAEKGIKNSIEKQVRINELIKLEAEKKGITIADAEVEIAVNQVRRAYASPKKFNADLKRQGLTVDDYKKNIKDQLLTSKMMKEVTKDVSVTDKEAKKYYNEHKGEFGGKRYSKVAGEVKQKLLQQKQRAQINEFVSELE